MMTNFISVGTQQLLIDLFDDPKNTEALEKISKLPVEQQYAIEELLKESGC